MTSVVIPVYNEEENLVRLHDELLGVLNSLADRYEVIYVDDGSIDSSGELLRELASKEAAVKVVTFRSNFGQTAAIMAGIDYASGDVVATMDADQQNDPADIPKLLGKLDEGYDLVAGWRTDRKDKRFSRVLTSRVANWVISRASGIDLHDYGCTLKVYRRDTIKRVRLYGEMHRFIPIYVSWQGGRVTEMPVSHRPRLAGQSKYGLERVMKVMLDLIVVQFLGRYETKPIYVFGGFGLLSMALAVVAGLQAVYYKLMGLKDFVEIPLPLIAVMAMITGVMSILMGLLAEILVRTYYEAQQKNPYDVRETLNTDQH